MGNALLGHFMYWYVKKYCLNILARKLLPYLPLKIFASKIVTFQILILFSISEFICLMYFMGRIFHEMLVTNNFKVFWKDTKHVTNAIIIFITLVDICVYVTMKESGSPKCIRISRPLRAFLLVNFPEARQIRRAFRTIRRTLPELINVLILFMATLTLFTLMAVKLFERLRLENGTYFTDFFDSFWELYVLVTTANR